jgi:acyl-CoA synthetase (AMP-forming)/AMP-acid ligase II
MFDAQCELIGETYGITEKDVDLATFPLFALFSVGLGMTAVIPDMDPTRPAHVNPKKIVEAIQTNNCTFSFGSPALWGRVTSWCVDNNVKLPTLRQVLMSGAPVPVEVHERFRKILSEGAETNTPYGATESLPATTITGSEILRETALATAQGKGVCVGRPVSGITVEIIRITDEVIEAWSDDLVVPRGEIGEITVKGVTVTKRYYRNEEATKAHKIGDGSGVRHRIGDVGYKDEQGRVWFCGRKVHRVPTEKGVLYTVPCEAIFNAHPAVKRSALVGVDARPVIIIELNDGGAGSDSLTEELLSIGAKNALTEDIRDVLYHPGFPVDIRHNAKINREKLAVWAAKKVRDRGHDNAASAAHRVPGSSMGDT